MTIKTTKKNGWNETKLQEVADINALSIDKNYTFDKIEYIDITSVEDRKIQQKQELNLDQAPSRARRIIRDNDILISTVRPNLKHYCFIKNASKNMIGSTGFAVISTNPEKADSKYIYYLLTTEEYTEYLSKIAEGHAGTYPSFNPEVLKNSSFLLPPPPNSARLRRCFRVLMIRSSFCDRRIKRWKLWLKRFSRNGLSISISRTRKASRTKKAAAKWWKASWELFQKIGKFLN